MVFDRDTICLLHLSFFSGGASEFSRHSAAAAAPGAIALDYMAWNRPEIRPML
jgi:hypothetical protein